MRPASKWRYIERSIRRDNVELADGKHTLKYVLYSTEKSNIESNLSDGQPFANDEETYFTK